MKPKKPTLADKVNLIVEALAAIVCPFCKTPLWVESAAWYTLNLNAIHKCQCKQARAMLLKIKEMS